ncbi:fructosamine kinase family protein [Cyanobium sp. T1B-Tous]|uniref:fructosamine kinase family protein n=1 Tax=Cyanobium sp. T1B-Tous TaxID=2823721 RepID=UPI0020CD624A|nr:fructosamine kinase family protein [Cyanobium sp. T1B-Tous]MCP9805626.1 fructosamine kinase family protein [Cyanobium sp. T1B-Tous]
MAPDPPECLVHWLQHHLGQGLVGWSPVGGGCIHRAWRLELAGGGLAFAKTNTAAQLPLLEAEVLGLRALASHAPPGLVIPEPLAWGVAGEQAVLVLGWLNLGGRLGGVAARQAWFRLGQGLAALHRSSAVHAPTEGYGWAADNFLGSAPQTNSWRQDWAPFFADCRLAPQLAWAARRGQPLRGGQALLERLPHWLAGHRCQPALVHGDLWSGNAGLLADGATAIFDPACYWGDREVDLAMAQLFGGFPPAFFEGYAAAWPLEPGAAERVALYNLYHLLNHANLFGGDYHRQAQASINALLA